MAGNMDVHDIRGCYFLDNAGYLCANISVVDVVCKESSKETGKEATLARDVDDIINCSFFYSLLFSFLYHETNKSNVCH